MSTTVAFEARTPENLKIAPISDRAFRLWFNCACYCHRNLTDGRVPAILILSLSPTATKRTIEELIGADLLERDGLTYRVHDYLDHNPSRGEVEDARRAGRERTRKWRGDGVRDASHHDDVTAHSRVSHAGARPAAPEEKRSTTETSKADEKTLLVCDRLAAQILERDPQADVDPRSERWLRAARLLLTTDGRSVEQVSAVLEWLPTDSFWSTVILSMPKLREKFTQLVARMNAASAPSSALAGRASASDLIRKINEAEEAA